MTMPNRSDAALNTSAAAVTEAEREQLRTNVDTRISLDDLRVDAPKLRPIAACPGSGRCRCPSHRPGGYSRP